VVLDGLFILVRDILTELIAAVVLNRQVEATSPVGSFVVVAKFVQDVRVLWGVPHGGRSLVRT
jgi:hypothetical protein